MTNKTYQYFLISIITIISLFGSVVNAQNCTPDPLDYTSVPELGVMLPKTLADATVGEYYNHSATFGIPTKAKSGSMTYNVNWVKFIKITNVVAGNQWTVVNSTGSSSFSNWDKGTWQCVSFYGTPTVAGLDTVRVYVDANVNVAFVPYTQKNHLAFTLPLKIVEGTTGLQAQQDFTERLIENYPNPFIDRTQVGLVAEKNGTAKLAVYSALGQLIYTEEKEVIPGDNLFDFDGSLLSEGNYIYTVATADKYFHGKLMKMK